MNASYVAPERDKEAFHCPHCNVMAQQVWRPLFWEEGQFHSVPMGQSRKEQKINLAISNDEMMRIAECQHCKEVSIWLYKQMLYPDGYAPPPNEDLSDEIKRDYSEARSIVNKSPRGAAGLLRLCIERLSNDLGAQGKDLNEKIGYLVREKNLDQRIQQSLDVVRVVGNEAVHPGMMDIRDDRETALRLFELMNLIADTMVTLPRQIQGMYEKLPSGKKKGIENRDKRK